MSVEKMNGSFIRYIKRYDNRNLIITCKNGDRLLLHANPTDYGYDAEIKIRKLEDGEYQR